MSFDGFSMHPLVMELNDTLTGGRIDKITQPNKHTILLSIRQPGKSHLLHISIHPQNPAAYLLQKNLENPPEPPVFCMVLRKQIETGRIAAIRQYGLDRIVLIDIDTLAAGGKIVTKTLVLEFMGKYSNIILLQDEHVIIDALRKIGENSSRIRTVLPGQPYQLPPKQNKLNLLEEDINVILSELQKQTESTVSKALLAVCLGFGPVSAKETACRARIPANEQVKNLTQNHIAALKKAMEEIRISCETPDGKAVILCDKNKKVLAMAAFPLHYLPDSIQLSFATLSDLLEQADNLLGSYTLPDKERFRKLVKNELHRARIKLEKLQQEQQDAENANDFKICGDNLMTYQYQFKDHADSYITVNNIYSETGAAIEIALDRKFTLVQNMQAYYKKYDKLKRAQSLLKEQISKNKAEIAYLESIETSLEASSHLAEINEIHNELVTGGYLKETCKKKNNDKPARPFHFHAPDGTEILVGKNNFQNDRLTFKTANSRDLWLHAKDIPGSHVILRTEGASPSHETLLLAAQLAGHFSQAKDSSKIPVDYTQVRYVKKPTGAKPGFVIFTNQKTLYITPEENLLAPILLQESK